LAAASNAGIRPFVVCSTVVIVTFGWSLWYAAMVWASHAEAPGASCWPHHHMVRWMGPLGTLVVAGPGAVPGVDTAGPALWPLVPLLYLPGVPAAGQRLYLWVARNRYHLVPCHAGACAVPRKKS